MIQGNVPLLVAILQKIIGTTEDKHFLDVCCGEMTCTRRLHFASHFGIDVVNWPQRPRNVGFEQADVLTWPGPKRFYDVAFAGDAIEHFVKEDGLLLLQHMQQWAHQIIIFTPMGEYLIDTTATDPHAHKSGWVADDFHKLGWATEEYPYWHYPAIPHLGAFFAWTKP